MLATWLRKNLYLNAGKRLPLSEPPLRFPGQTVYTELDDCLLDFALWIIFGGIIVIMLVGVPVFSFIHSNYVEAFMTAAFNMLLVVITYPLWMWRYRRIIKRTRNLYLGFVAESYVGQQIDRTRRFGCSVFHDIVLKNRGQGFNIDHIVIAPAGIFVVETKGRSKPDKGDTSLWVKNGRIQFSDGLTTDGPLKQAKTNAETAQQLLFDCLKRAGDTAFKLKIPSEIPVKPVVCYPGWYVDFNKSDPSDVYVTKDDFLLRYIGRREKIWTPTQVKHLSDIFGNHLRNERREMLCE